MAFGPVNTSAILTVDDDFEFLTDGTDAIVIQLTPRETATLNFVVDAAGTTDDLEIEVIQGHRISTGNGLDGLPPPTTWSWTRRRTGSRPTTT